MGKGLAVTRSAGFVAALLAITLLSACGNDKSEPSPIGAAVGGLAKSTLARVTGKGRAQAAPASTAPLTRAEIEKYGIPLLRVVIKARAADVLVTIRDTSGEVVTWTTTDGTTFTLKDGVLIQTRGLGPDLMSSAVPDVAELAQAGGTTTRAYFFLGDEDRGQRRDYTCSVAAIGPETITIYGKSHKTVHVREDCQRSEGRIANDFWIEGSTIRKSRQWTSPGIGYLEFEKAVD